MPSLDRFSPNDPARRPTYLKFECADDACDGWDWHVYGTHDSGVFEPDVEADCACPECGAEGRIA